MILRVYMKRYKPNESKDFTCKNCKRRVSGQAIGTKQRNHCPYCLYSLHVDVSVGDRKAICQKKMKPVGLSMKKDGEVMIVSECTGCGKIMPNRIAGDDNTDEILKLVHPNNTMETEVNLRKCHIELVKDKSGVEVQLFGKKYNGQ